MRVLVTGGAGFIGGHLIEQLLQDGHSVVAVDDLSTGNMRNLELVAQNPKFTFVLADVAAGDFDPDQLVSNSDVIFHLAAAVGVELVVHDPVRTIMTNVHGSEAMLKSAAKFDKRIILASTSEVYGKSQNQLFGEDDDLLIGCPTHSRWSYACSKLMDEFYLMAYCKSMNLKGTIVRFFNTVGPRQTGQYGMVIPRFVEKALDGKPILVYGNGAQSRCFCHVLDTVRALILLAPNPTSYGEIYNIGGSRSISILELAQLIKNQLQSDSEIQFVPYEKAYEAGFEDMMRRAPDTTKVHSLIGWQPKLTLEDVINDVAELMRQNQRS